MVLYISTSQEKLPLKEFKGELIQGELTFRIFIEISSHPEDFFF